MARGRREYKCPAGRAPRDMSHKAHRAEERASGLRDASRQVHLAAMVCGLTSCVCICVLHFFVPLDPGLAVYTSTPFTGWGTLSSMLQSTASVACPPLSGWPRTAYPGVGAPLAGNSTGLSAASTPRLSTTAAYPVSTPGPTTTAAYPVPTPGPMGGLQPLLDAAWCTAGFWPVGANPTNRSGACACVTAAWDGLSQSACGPNARAPVVPSADVRSQYAGQVLGCMALTPPYQTGQLSDLLSGVLPTGVAMYCNAVVFLACASFLLFFYFELGTGWIWVWMAVPFVFVSALLVYPATGQLLVLPGLFVSLLSVLLGLHDEREASQSASVTDELEVCSYGILPPILPAYALIAAVAGFGRDVGACATFMALGLFMGVGLQWLRLAVRTREGEGEALLVGDQAAFLDSTKGAVISAGLAGLAVHWAHLLAVGVAYYDGTQPLMLSKAWLWLLLCLLLAVGGLCAVSIWADGQRRGLATCWVMAVLVAGNLLLTGMACHDALVV